MEITPEQQLKLNQIYAEAYCILQTISQKLASDFAGDKLREFYENCFDNKKS